MIEIAQRGPESMILRWNGFRPADLPEVKKRARRWISADWQPASAMAALCEDGALIARGGGRLLRCSSFYEDFVKTLLTINTSWSSTCRMALALVTEPGGGGFPGPEAMLDYGEERLRECAKLGFRAPP
jgi:3-methyladenine DNA glycosylase/8-oxoguanine DNA glycosylase